MPGPGGGAWRTTQTTESRSVCPMRWGAGAARRGAPGPARALRHCVEARTRQPYYRQRQTLYRHRAVALLRTVRLLPPHRPRPASSDTTIPQTAAIMGRRSRSLARTHLIGGRGAHCMVAPACEIGDKAVTPSHAPSPIGYCRPRLAFATYTLQDATVSAASTA